MTTVMARFGYIEFISLPTRTSTSSTTWFWITGNWCFPSLISPQHQPPVPSITPTSSCQQCLIDIHHAIPVLSLSRQLAGHFWRPTHTSPQKTLRALFFATTCTKSLQDERVFDSNWATWTAHQIFWLSRRRIVSLVIGIIIHIAFNLQLLSSQITRPIKDGISVSEVM